MKSLEQKSKRPWTKLCGALVLAGAGVLTMQQATGDQTVGSLPSADGGDGSQCFYLTGPRDLVENTILDAWGDGYFVPVHLPDGEIWIEFYGSVCVTLDEKKLAAHPELETGLSAGFNGGGMVIVPEIDGVLSARRVSLDAGFSWATPYTAIEPLLDAALLFHTAQVQTGLRAELSYSAADGLFMVCQNLK